MPITERQRQQRRDFLGSSDAAALFGCVPSGPYDLYLEKTAELDPRPASPAMRLGNALEPVAIDLFTEWLAEKLDGATFKLARNQRRVHPRLSFMAANFDALGEYGETSGFSVEAKTSGLCSPWWATREWGEEETDEIPERVIIQAHHGFAVKPDLATCYCPVILGHGQGFKVYTVQRNPELVAEIEERETRFWFDHVATLTPPPADPPPKLETLARVRRVPAKVVDVPWQLVAEYESAAAQRLAAEKIEKAEKARLIAALGDAEGARIIGLDGRPIAKTLTFFETERAGFVAKPTKFRTVKIKG